MRKIYDNDDLSKCYLMRVVAPPELAGQYLKRFDLNKHAPGRPYPTGTAEFSSDPSEALRFACPQAALTAWRAQSTAVPLRPDGKPNRPLTAFTMEVVPIP